MAVCLACRQEMTVGVGCTLKVETVAGKRMTRVRYGQGRGGVDTADDGRSCHDCLVPPGAYHHPGCDAETCPNCGGQAIGCDCAYGKDDTPPG